MERSSKLRAYARISIRNTGSFDGEDRCKDETTQVCRYIPKAIILSIFFKDICRLAALQNAYQNT